VLGEILYAQRRFPPDKFTQQAAAHRWMTELLRQPVVHPGVDEPVHPVVLVECGNRRKVGVDDLASAIRQVGEDGLKTTSAGKQLAGSRHFQKPLIDSARELVRHAVVNFVAAIVALNVAVIAIALGV